MNEANITIVGLVGIIAFLLIHIYQLNKRLSTIRDYLLIHFSQTETSLQNILDERISRENGDMKNVPKQLKRTVESFPKTVRYLVHFPNTGEHSNE